MKSLRAFGSQIAFLVLLVSSYPLCYAATLSLSDPSSAIGERGLRYQGRDVFLVGTGSFWMLSDPYYYNSDGTTNLSRLRSHLDAYRPTNADGKGLGVIRVSAFGTPVRYSGAENARKRYPCQRSGTSGARDGGNKFDCSKLDEQYFSHVLTVVREANARGIVIGLILWDEIPLENNTNRWEHNPFCPQNSVNGYGLPSCDGDAVPEFYDLSKSALRNDQDAIVTRFVELLAAEPNVFFFIGNEYTGASAWREHQIDTIDAANTSFGTDLLHVSMDYGPGESSNSDGVSPDTNRDGLGSDAFRSDGRPSIAQRDYRGTAATAKRQNLWKRFMSGAASAGSRDSYDGDTPPATVYSSDQAEDEQLRRFVSDIDVSLSMLRPDNSPFSSGWLGRARTGQEYVALNTSSSGSVTIDLGGASGTWVLEEWDPTSTSAPVNRGEKTAGGSVQWSVGSGEIAIRVFPKSGSDTTVPKPPVIVP